MEVRKEGKKEGWKGGENEEIMVGGRDPGREEERKKGK